MAQAFNLTAQLQLQSPRNVNQVVNDIRRQLKPVGVQVKIENTRNLARANKDLAAFSRNARNSNKNMSELNRTLQESARRFSVITIATGSFLALANAFKKSVKEAVAFERELVRISQVTGKTVSQLSDLSGEVTRLSTTLGASSSDLLNVARTLTQAGFAATETRKALDILAKTSLGATFDNIQDTTEGAIALLRQFGNEAKRSGGDIKFLESSLDAINSVSKRFAVESGDLISAIRRTGGVFAAAGGSVNELIALFTSVRATTRESAETIATGLRTIFTRIQRVETIEQLKALNIQLQDSEGRFVGAFEAIKRLSEGLKFLDPRDFRFSQVVEELGGFRQIGKVIPLINQFATAQEALNVAQGASGSVSRDALVAQQSLGVQVQKVREQFDALIRKFADSSTFRSIAGFAINLAEAFIKVADSLEPLLPLLVSLVGLKLGQGIAPALAGIAGIGRRAGGTGPVTKFARGGMVPGSGNRDTVPAMLTPGEFVIRKSSVNKLGAGTLAAMNENRFAEGARIRKTNLQKLKSGEEISLPGKELGIFKSALLRKAGDKDGDSELDIGGAFLQPEGVTQNTRATIQGSEILAAAIGKVGGNQADAKKFLKSSKGAGPSLKIPINISSGSLSKRVSGRFRAGISKSLRNFSEGFAAKEVGLPFSGPKFTSAFRQSNIEQIEGGIFESFINGLSNKPIDNSKINPNDVFDFRNGLGSAGKAFGLPSDLISDAKRTFTTNALASLVKKGGNLILENITGQLANSLLGSGVKGPKGVGLTETAARRQTLATGDILSGNRTVRRNSGGGIAGSDTVPALLTPGEFVFNKGAAQSIGYSNLNRMNKQGVQGFAKGGVVSTGMPAGGRVTSGRGFYGDSVDVRSADTIKRMDDENEKRNQVVEGLEKNKIQIDKNGNIIDKNNQKRSKLGPVLDKLSSGANSARRSLDKITGGRASKAVIGAARISSKEGRAAFAGRANEISGAAQQFVFLGASVAALTGQMSGLEDSTKKAINETAGFASGIVGVGGTVVQVLSSLATSSSQAAIAKQIESKASGEAATGDLIEAKSSKLAARSAGAGAKLASAFGILSIAVVGVVSVLKFFSAKASAEADKLSKGLSDRLAKVKEEGGTVGGLGDIEKAAELQQRSSNLSVVTTDNLVEGLGGAALGATIGTLIAPGLGTAIGAAVGFGVGKFVFANEELSAAQLRQVDSIKQNIQSLEGLYNASLKADQALADIDATRGLTSEEKSSRLTEVSRELGGDAALPAIQEANVQLAFLASSVGKKASELQESDFEGEALLQFQTATAQAAAGQESIAKRVKIANDALSEAISATDGTKGFNELIAEGGTFAQAFRQAREATVARTQAEIDALERSGASQEEINAARKRGSDQLKNLTSGTARVIDAQKAQREELIKAKEAAAAFRAELAKGRAFTAALEAQGRALERQGQALDDFTANLEGRSTEFKAQEIVGLDNVGEVQNLSRFFAEIDNVAAQAGPEAQKSAEALKKNAKILKGSSILQGIDATVSNLRETVVGSLSAVGVSAETFGGGARGKSIFDNIVKELEDGAQEAGGLTKESIDKALSPVAELVDQQANNFKLINNNQNAQLANYSKFLDAQDALFNKELEGRSRIAEVAAKGAELRAKARGEELSPQAQEAARRRQAQVQLAGTGLRAGDVRQVSTAKQQAKQALANIQAQKAQANAIGLSVARRKELAKQERQQLKVIKAANGELERLADQSDRASSILSQIDEERQKRQVQFELLQEFVVGGQEERGALNQAALGIQNAIKTGTLQGQSSEQRSATVGLLERLENIVIPGTGGLTGEEVKQELVFRDALSLGLDPQIAKSIATATSKEQQLIDALDRLTNQMLAAAAAAAPAPAPGAVPTVFPAKGGLIQYRANGGSIFQPKGTDTVPAMLTPGEFVIRKSAVDKVGIGALQAINNGANVVPSDTSNSAPPFALGGKVNYLRFGGFGNPGFIIPNPAFGPFQPGLPGGFSVGPGFQSIVTGTVPAAFGGGGLRPGFAGPVAAGNRIAGPEVDFTSANQLEFVFKKGIANAGLRGLSGYTGVDIPAVGIRDRRKLEEAIKSGNFDVNALRTFQYVKSYTEKLQAHKDIFSVLGGGGVKLKQPNFNNLAQIADYRTSLTAAMTTIDNFVGDPRFDNAAFIMGQGGINIRSRNRDLKKVLKQSEKALEVYERAVAAGNVDVQKTAIQGFTRVSKVGNVPDDFGATEALVNFGFATGGKVPYFASGGGVGGDSVPAMLTPGEFVMNASTVKKYGVGFMNQVNKGNLPGFNKGGAVGGVQYKQDGGTVAGGPVSLTIEASRIQGVFDGFVANFSSVLDNIVAPFNNVVQNLNQLSQAFGNLTMQHTVNVEGLISVGGLNIDSIKNELSQSIGEMVAGEVQRVMNDQQKNFKSN